MRAGYARRRGCANGSFVDVPAGVYGLAVFHDRNGNQILDRNLFGIPTEPYDFSRNYIGFKAPSFDACIHRWPSGPHLNHQPKWTIDHGQTGICTISERLCSAIGPS